MGTLANQTQNGGPPAALSGGDRSQGGVLSFLPGQKLSRCTCKGESHPGPVHADGTYVGRSAPEIDIFEAQVCLAFLITSIVGSRTFTIDHRGAFNGSGVSVRSMGGKWMWYLFDFDAERFVRSLSTPDMCGSTRRTI